jgi:hypothetical protein
MPGAMAMTTIIIRKRPPKARNKGRDEGGCGLAASSGSHFAA